MSKIVATPQARRTIINTLLDNYKRAGVIADWTWEVQSRRWVIHTPNGTMLIYGPQQVEAFTQGVQAFAFRLNLGPLTLEPQMPDDEYDEMLREAQEDEDSETAHNDHGDGNQPPPF
jgi:hypothetical protein